MHGAFPPPPQHIERAVLTLCVPRLTRSSSSSSPSQPPSTSPSLPARLGGVFAQRAHSAGTAPIITLFIPGTPLKTTPLQKRAGSIQKSIRGAEFRTLGPVASIRLKQKIPGVPAGAVGCRIHDPLGVKNSRLFAQRARSAGTAVRPPYTQWCSDQPSKAFMFAPYSPTST